MSEMEYRYGKLKKLDMGGSTLEEYCERLCNENGITQLSNYNDNWAEEVEYELGEKYMVLNNKVYEIIENKWIDPEELCRINILPDGTIDYVASFYNGGTYLGEVLEEKLKELEEQ